MRAGALVSWDGVPGVGVEHMAGGQGIPSPREKGCEQGAWLTRCLSPCPRNLDTQADTASESGRRGRPATPYAAERLTQSPRMAEAAPSTPQSDQDADAEPRHDPLHREGHQCRSLVLPAREVGPEVGAVDLLRRPVDVRRGENED